MDERPTNYTTINHNARQSLGLSWVEYGLADLIYNLTNNPHNKVPGWCYASKGALAEFLGVSEREIFRMIDTLVEKKLIEKHPITKHVRITIDWYNTVIIKDTDKMSDTMTDGHTTYDKMSVEHYDEMSYNKDIYNKDINKDTKEKNILKKESPQSLEDITQEELQAIAENYKVPLAFVNFQLERLRNYCDSKGKRYKDYKAALRNFILGDIKKMAERRNYATDTKKYGVDATDIR